MTKVALVQMVSSTQVSHNLEQVEKWLLKAVEQDVKLVVLPENFAFMGVHEADKLRVGEVYGQGIIQDTISRLAKQHGLWIVAGTMPIKGQGSKVRASCLVYDERGAVVARYDKIHLFDVRVSEQEAHQESHSIERGDAVEVVDTPVGKIGLSVCYDLRFPELYQQMMHKGAQLFTVPSAFTAVTGVAHWEVLLRARAIENLAYVLAANQGGEHESGRVTYGHSLLVDPWGKVTAQAGSGAGLVTGEIDLHHQALLRKQFPCNEHHVL